MRAPKQRYYYIVFDIFEQGRGAKGTTVQSWVEPFNVARSTLQLLQSVKESSVKAEDVTGVAITNWIEVDKQSFDDWQRMTAKSSKVTAPVVEVVPPKDSPTSKTAKKK
jgi:hypothetical protein